MNKNEKSDVSDGPIIHVFLAAFDNITSKLGPMIPYGYTMCSLHHICKHFISDNLIHLSSMDARHLWSFIR